MSRMLGRPQPLDRSRLTTRPQGYHRKEVCSPNFVSPSHKVARQAATSPNLVNSGPRTSKLLQLLNQPFLTAGSSMVWVLASFPITVRSSKRSFVFGQSTFFAFH